MDRLVWVCVAYTAATFTVDLIDSCWCAGEILYDIYKQRRKQAEKVSRKKIKIKAPDFFQHPLFRLTNRGSRSVEWNSQSYTDFLVSCV